MSQIWISVITNLVIVMIAIIGSIIFLYKSKIESKGYRLFFVMYIIFWIPIMLTRPYRGSVQNLIDPSLLVWSLAAYGAVGIFMRPLSDFLALYLHDRKIVLYSAAIIVIISFLPFIFVQTSATNIIQSIGIGVGASLIGTYELMFKEQYGKSRSLLTVSILAIPPLVADFMTAPIQSIVRTFVNEANTTNEKIEIYSILWMIAIFIMAIFLFIFIFVKENRSCVGMQYGNQIIAQKNKNILLFLTIILTGMIIIFIKFSNSGSVGTLQLQLLQEHTKISVASAEGYLSTIFSSTQLLGTFFLGYLMLKKVSKQKMFLIGIIIWILYHLISSFIANPIGYMAIHGLNGFAYGMLYNLLLGFILSFSFDKGKLYTPMGMYQSLLAIGITSSSFFTTFIKKSFQLISPNADIQDLLKPTFIINFIIIGILIMTLGLFAFVNHFEKKAKISQLPNI